MKIEDIKVGDTVRITWTGTNVRTVWEGRVASVGRNEITLGSRPGQSTLEVGDDDIIELIERPAPRITAEQFWGDGGMADLLWKVMSEQ